MNKDESKKFGIAEFDKKGLLKSELGKILYKKLLKVYDNEMWALGIMDELYNDDIKIQKIMDIVDSGADFDTIHGKTINMNRFSARSAPTPSEKRAGFAVRRIYYYEDRAYYYYYITDVLKDGAFVKYRTYKSNNGEELTKREDLKTDLDKKLYDNLKPLSPHPDWLELMLMLSSGDDRRKILLDFINKEKDWDKIDEFVIETWG